MRATHGAVFGGSEMTDESPQIRRIPAPSGLSRAGRRLWKSVVDAYDLRPDEQVLLENASRTADYVAQLDAALKDAPLVVLESAAVMPQDAIVAAAEAVLRDAEVDE
ncbi:hypothetical protein ACFT5B_03820 [Luteimicrobium sp. NPDC057192]|uniref:hypothetical protein n=1 Tax=Luteimicrobium sp. NPDC057192 TaxID=3346042 RepID=UPI003626D24A